jgi:hypothetical protein
MALRGAMSREGTARQPLCADIDGFSLHAAVQVEAHDRKRLEQLCRYITRPALSDERVQLNTAGQVELELKTPWRDGTAHLVMSPLEFMQRLTAPIPKPRLHQPKSASQRPVLVVGRPVWVGSHLSDQQAAVIRPGTGDVWCSSGRTTPRRGSRRRLCQLYRLQRSLAATADLRPTVSSVADTMSSRAAGHRPKSLRS